jgi:hypothetical protein
LREVVQLSVVREQEHNRVDCAGERRGDVKGV